MVYVDRLKVNFSVLIILFISMGMINSCVDQGVKSTDPAAPQISVSDMTVVEGSTFLFLVSMTTPTLSIITFNYATSNQSAISGQDFIAAAGVDSIQAGLQSTTILVSTTDDSLLETAETFLLTLSSALGAKLMDSVAQGTITDNESPGVSFANDLQPILKTRCAKLGICHGATPGGGQLYIGTAATYSLVRNASGQNGPIVVADSSARSSLYTVLTNFPFPSTQMPQDGPPYLTTNQQQLFRDWIDQGALDN